jgi:hypothetical protein
MIRSMKPLLKRAKVGKSFLIWRTCPNCHQQFDIESALHLSGWSSLAPSNFGVRCPICKMVLAAHQRKGFGAFWAVFAIVFTFAFVGIMTKHLTRVTVLPIVVGMAIFAVLMSRWKIRSLIELSVPPSGVVLREVHSSAKDYAYLEGKDGRERELRIETPVAEDSRPEWICSNCKQSNPGSFDVCWKCNHRHPGWI